MKPTQIFTLVRDIPYRIPESHFETDMSCFGKHILLENALKGVGIEVRPMVCDFRWSDLSLPAKILALPHKDLITHVCLEFRLDREWYPIDASFDIYLAPALPVNAWDGKSATNLAVKPLRIYSPEESHDLYLYEEDVADELKINSSFYKALNSWMDNIRGYRR